MAGGKASRMGQDKLALPWGKNTVLGTVLGCVLESGMVLQESGQPKIEIWVVAQKPPSTYLPKDLSETFGRLNGHWQLSIEQPLSRNIYAGLQNLSPEICGVGFLPGDQIGVNALELAALIRYFSDRKPPILVPFNGHNGSPVLFDRRYVPLLSMLEGEQGGKEIIKSNPQWIERYPVSRAFLKDIDTPEDYRELIMKKQIYERLNFLMDSKKNGALGTVVAGCPEICPAGAKFLVDETGDDLAKEIPEPLFLLLQEALPEIIRNKKPQVMEVVFQEVPLKIFIDPVYPQERVIILGGGHIALPLVSMAKLLNYQVTVIDDRPLFAAADRFPQADLVRCEDFSKAIREMSFDRNTYVIIITRGHQHDQTCLAEVLRQPQPAYIGMIGSKRKVSALFAELRKLGCDQESLDRVYAPIGLDIGAQTPEEIALSIMAEVVMVNRYGFSRGLKMKQGGEKVGP